MRNNKSFLGGIFKLPSFKNVKEILRGKLGYLPRDDTEEVSDLYMSNLTSDPPIIIPTTYLRRKSF